MIYEINPSMLNAFVRSRKWGVQAYYKHKYHIKTPMTREMNEGIELHKELGYDNEQLFEKQFQVGEDTIIMRGIPDKIDSNGYPYEAKTIKGTFVPADKIAAAEAQLLCYLFLMDAPIGYVVFISRDLRKEVMKRTVFRNDYDLMLLIKSFLYELKYQKQLPDDKNGNISR